MHVYLSPLPENKSCSAGLESLYFFPLSLSLALCYFSLTSWKRKTCLVWAEDPPIHWLSCGKGAVMVNWERSLTGREDTHTQHTHRSEGSSVLRWCSGWQINRTCLEEQRETWWDSGERKSGIAQGDMTLVWPVSRPPVSEHEKEQVVYTPLKKEEEKKATIATTAPGCYLG